MLSPDEWAKTIHDRISEREAEKRAVAGSPDYEAMRAEMAALWLKTQAAFEEYSRSFCKQKDILQYSAFGSSITIRRTDAEELTLTIVRDSSSILARVGGLVCKYNARLTTKGLELTCDSNELRTSPEEIAAVELERLLLIPR